MEVYWALLKKFSWFVPFIVEKIYIYLFAMGQVRGEVTTVTEALFNWQKKSKICFLNGWVAWVVWDFTCMCAHILRQNYTLHRTNISQGFCSTCDHVTMGKGIKGRRHSLQLVNTSELQLVDCCSSTLGLAFSMLGFKCWLFFKCVPPQRGYCFHYFFLSNFTG